MEIPWYQFPDGDGDPPVVVAGPGQEVEMVMEMKMQMDGRLVDGRTVPARVSSVNINFWSGQTVPKRVNTTMTEANPTIVISCSMIKMS